MQFVPLSGFDPDQQDPEHFIVDKDFYAWMKRYIAPEVNILMMVDWCHSGSMQRSIKPQLYGYVARAAFTRRGQPLELVARPGPRFGILAGTGMAAAAEINALDPEDLPNLVYFGASQDGQLALDDQLPGRVSARNTAHRRRQTRKPADHPSAATRTEAGRCIRIAGHLRALHRAIAEELRITAAAAAGPAQHGLSRCVELRHTPVLHGSIEQA